MSPANGLSWPPVLVLVLSVSVTIQPPEHRPAARSLAEGAATQLLIGSLADVSVAYAAGKPTTVVHILDFKRDAFPQEPYFSQVRLCGDHSRELAVAVHTNIALVYGLASPSRSTDCLSLISVRPWQDDSKWQTVTFEFNSAKNHRALRRPSSERRSPRSYTPWK